MWRSRVVAALLLLACLFPCRTSAGDSENSPSPTAATAARQDQAGQPLTLEHCVEIALEKNPRQRAARFTILAADQAVGTARAPYYPEVTATGGYRRFDRHVFLPDQVSNLAESTTLGGRDDWHGSLQANYLLYDSGRRHARLQAALTNLAVSEKEADQIRQDLILNVHEAYFNLVAGLKEEAAAEESLARRRKHLELVRIRFEAGDVPEADIIRTRVEVANAELDLVKTRSQVRTARAGLNAAMGLSVLLEVRVEAASPPLLSPGEIDLEEALQTALDRRPEFGKALHQVKLSRHEMTATRSAYGPKLAAEAGYGRHDEEFFPEDQEWFAGVNLEVPLFTGFARRHEVARTRAELGRAEADKEGLRLTIQEEVAAAYSRLIEAQQSTAATRVLVEEAEESLRLTRKRYEVGAATINDLLDVEASFSEAESAHIRALYGYHLATSRYQRAVGGLRE